MKPDIFQYRPSGDHVPQWEHISALHTFMRSFVDPITGARVDEGKMLERNQEKYSRLETLTSGLSRGVVVFTKQRPGSREWPRCIDIERPVFGGEEPTIKLSYIPDKKDAPLNTSAMFTPESSYADFTAYYSASGTLRDFVLRVSEDSEYDESNVQENRERLLRPYRFGLIELGDLLRLGVDISLVTEELADSNKREVSELIHDEEIRLLTAEFAAHTQKVLSGVVASDIAENITQSLTFLAMLDYLGANGEVAYFGHGEIGEEGHPFISHLNASIGRALNIYYDELEMGPMFDIKHTPARNPNLFISQIVDREGTPISSPQETSTGKVIRFENHQFQIVEADENIVFQFGHQGRGQISTPEHEISTVRRVPMKHVVSLIKVVDSTDWNLALPFIVPIYRPITAEDAEIITEA